MALKTPVIAHAVGGIPTVLNQGECGILVSEHQASAYANAIYQLIKSSDSRKKYIENAFNRVTDFYSSEQNANAYHQIYWQLVQ
jgi:glycosyltransferase involved in cell wall biosynthesis